jgi:hypothetical protein
MSITKADLFITSTGSTITASCSIYNEGTMDTIMPVALAMNLLQMANEVSQNQGILPPNLTDIWAGLQNPLSGPGNPIAKEAFDECMRKTAGAGSRLFLLLKRDIGEILQQIDELPDGTYLTIHTNCAFFPWEILTSQIYDETMTAEPPKKELMWGYRFVTNYNYLSKAWTSNRALLKAHRSGEPFVSFNLNPTIDNGFKTANFKPIKYQIDFYERDVPAGKGALFQTGVDIRRQLLTGEQPSTLIYIYCHGGAASVFGSGGSAVLEVDENAFIDPMNVTMATIDYKRGPVVFLNSCESSSHSPAVLTHFLEAFREKKAAGIIGTVIKIPATFAAAFGCAIIKEYLQGKQLGVALFEIRRRLVDLNNPLGLFYSLQCPAEISISV